MVTHAAVAITALAPTIHRVAEAEAALVGTDGSPDAVKAAANAAAAAARPIDDVRASADYRRAMAAVITRPRHPGRTGPGPRRDRGRSRQRIHLRELK